MGSKKLWCVAIRPESDSPYEQSPAISKEIAERAVARYKAMTEKEGNPFSIESFDDLIQVQQWHGTRKEHENECFYTEGWFEQPMYQCKNIEQAELAFKYGEIVRCYDDKAELITRDFEEAKRFYEVA
ncbi:hypothetical protein B9T25_13125 [Acinetobacter sp. ANC 4470]|uniref:hypothetical protein n=1 Tax=Acinetobacter sp. ANC 4470 TaxID=1977881 RepID=UPI000A333EF0|nr:hypothetical protein [Acinetobacter sp. ANC 4470]OTG64377.1 hypothetical protein B9T25_13125 [Acinetobacter sp. ANC 4470]